ncbi:matrixin family metalloprotease [Tardiphaga sp. 866_E4_N2_1]|uniref:matrixin family metalloprotease n=1 Tax=unclassified Tardiphaga TaxID=2631404 RepID=UPI003F214D1D
MAYSISLEGEKWGSTAIGSGGGTITWSFGIGAGNFFSWANSTFANFSADISAAFARWEQIANLDFVQVADSSAVNIRIGSTGIDGPGQVLGQASYSYSGSSFRFAEIGIDNAEQWTDTTLYEVALHEIGHAIGLDHHSGDPSIMGAYLNPALTDLQPYDIAAIQYLYGPAALPPVLTARNLTEAANYTPISLSAQLTYTDVRPAVSWRVQDISKDGLKALLLDGVPLSASTPVTLTAAQFQKLTIATVYSDHEIWVVANDGSLSSAPVRFTVSPSQPRSVPVVTATDFYETAGTPTSSLSAHLTYSDAFPAVSWRIQDVSSDGTSGLLLNGAPLVASAPVTLTAAQFAQVSIAAVTSSHEIWATSSDGIYSSAPVHFSVLPAPRPVPVLTATDLNEQQGSGSVALSAQLSYGGDPLPAVSWRIQDVSTDGSSALLLNGVPVTAASPITLTAAQFAQTSIGVVTSHHEIWATASDGYLSSAPVHFGVSAPVITPPSVTAVHLQEVAGAPPIPLASQLTFHDNLSAVTWRIQDVSSEATGALYLAGTPLNASHPVDLTAAQFAQITIGAVRDAHEIWATASNGSLSSAPVHFSVSPAPHAITSAAISSDPTSVDGTHTDQLLAMSAAKQPEQFVFKAVSHVDGSPDAAPSPNVVVSHDSNGFVFSHETESVNMGSGDDHAHHSGAVNWHALMVHDPIVEMQLESHEHRLAHINMAHPSNDGYILGHS